MSADSSLASSLMNDSGEDMDEKILLHLSGVLSILRKGPKIHGEPGSSSCSPESRSGVFAERRGVGERDPSNSFDFVGVRTTWISGLFRLPSSKGATTGASWPALSNEGSFSAKLTPSSTRFLFLVAFVGDCVRTKKESRFPWRVFGPTGRRRKTRRPSDGTPI